MGIQGLLQFIKPLLKDKHISDYQGETLGVDTYGWYNLHRIHKAIFACGRELVKGQPTRQHINYIVKKALDLKNLGVELVMVFDGAPMPCKQETEEDRRLARKENLKKAEELEKLGNSVDAERYYNRAVDVSPALAKEVIEELQKYNIECIVAPYEADAQLAYLCKIGYITGVISEDSDLIVFGSTKILYKLEASGSVKELLLNDLWNHPGYNLKRWTHDQFILMCVLAGCDYLKSVKNMGLKTAYKYVSQNSDIKVIISKLKRELVKVPDDYQQQFFKAVYSFKYHKVYCPLKGNMVTMNPLPEVLEVNDLNFLGETLSQIDMIGVAKGRLNPFTREPFNGKNVKRRIDEIFQPIPKIVPQKRIKVSDEVEYLAKKLKIERSSQKSKYFGQTSQENDKDSYKDQSDPNTSQLTGPQNPPVFESTPTKPALSGFSQLVTFINIDLTSFFLK